MLQQNIGHIAKYQDSKNHPKFVQTAKTANVHFHFPLRNLQPQTCGLINKFHEEKHRHLKMLAVFRAGVPNLGYMYPQGNLCLSKGVTFAYPKPIAVRQSN